jgi:hypothetical protein
MYAVKYTMNHSTELKIDLQGVTKLNYKLFVTFVD